MAPDIEVEMTPAEVIAGKDPQLERAIAIVMDELKKNPTPEIKRPAYPVKHSIGVAQQRPADAVKSVPARKSAESN